MLARSLFVLGIGFMVLALLAHRIQVGCPKMANPAASEGWSLLQDGDVDGAQDAFERARLRCPDHVGARTGLGFVALRRGDDLDAGRWFAEVLSVDSLRVDALVGQGLLAWRAGELERGHGLFLRALELDPGRTDVLQYLTNLPEGFGPPPERPPLVRPDTLQFPARAVRGRFEVRTTTGWRPFYVNGVNLGAALPGKFAGEFPDSATYARWLSEIADLGANTVRLYTIHPPSFYRALLDHNTRAARPLWIVHGVWAERPPNDDYDDPSWKHDFFAEMRTAVDVIHGRADVRPRPGRASGHYVADVSRWTLGFVIGREWEASSVLGYNRLRPDRTAYRGRYLELESGTPMDAWLAEASDFIVAYETDTYGAQRPVAYVSWPTLDPLTHPTETTAEEEVALRTGQAPAAGYPVGHGDDAVAVDPTLVRATDAYPAGYFAAYNVYPYYPDFMVLDPGYSRARSPFGPSNYFGYLTHLKAHHGDQPVLIAEYGMPAGHGTAHLHPQGWHEGGLGEQAAAAIIARMTREIQAAGMAGGVVFAWIDEWFKQNWLTQDFALPAERGNLWYNHLDPEQHHGLVAVEPVPRIPGGTLSERLGPWRAVPPLYATDDGVRVRALADEAALNLLVELGPRRAEEVLVGFELGTPTAGSFRWPGVDAPAIPTGVDFVLRATADDVRILANPEANPFEIQHDTAGLSVRREPRALAIVNPPPGLFQDRVRQITSVQRQPLRRENGRFDPLLVAPNRLRVGRDGTEYLAVGYDRGVLRGGSPPDGLWEWTPDGSALEVRIPWMLINVTDPSSRHVLDMGSPPEPAGRLPVRQVDGIRIAAALRYASDAGEGGARWVSLPQSGNADDLALFGWPGWEQPRWRERRRPAFNALRDTFLATDPHGAPLRHELPR